MTPAARVREVARDQFGYEGLRPGQEPAIRAVLDGRDALAILPTGHGKSAIYQIAATLVPGATVVVSPLIALQRDQVDAIEEEADADAVGGAEVVNSGVSPSARREAFEGLADGSTEFLFLAPEQFDNPQTLEGLRASNVSLFVVDEAHLISAWGHDFRPAYLRLGSVIEDLGHPTVLALTATASPPVREEIVARLGMRDPLVVVRGFDRPNIWLGVERFADEATKRRALVERIRDLEPPGLVYTATRRRTEQIAGELAETGRRVAAYHAGMGHRQRDETQQRFMDDELDVVVATTAFGMGVDKPNVRYVLHADVPESLDAYYQEIGRGGRDGEPAKGILLYRPEDFGIRRYFAAAGRIGSAELEKVVRAIRRAPAGGSMDADAIRKATGLSRARVSAALSRLAETSAVTVAAGGEVGRGSWDAPPADVADLASRNEERRREVERSRIEMMRGYAEAQTCRRIALLTYFGEPIDEPCGNCDVCDGGLATAVEEGTVDRPFPLQGRVVHQAWGEGTVMRYEGDRVAVLFDNVGYKTLDLALVVDEGLLGEAAPGR